VTDAKFGTWVVPESPVDIEYSLVVIDEIRQVVADGFQRLQRGGIEVGGVLYGTREDRTVRILAMREIACEHARGPTFHLSDNDRAALTAQLARDKEDMRLEGLLVVGWFLSHTRSDVTLQQSDLDTYTAFFPEPWQVTMVVHPGRVGAMRAGFFVREPDGTVKGERSYQEFNFPDRLAGVLDRAPRERRPLIDPPPGDRLPSARYPAVPDAPGSIETGPIETRDPREQNDEPPARYDAPLFGQPARPIPQYSPYPNTGRKIPWAIIGVVVAALLAAVAGLKYLGPQLNAEPLSLGMIEQSGQLQIQWNRASRSIVNATGGTLEIVDGQDKRDIPMNRSELEQGSFTYARRTGDVQVRLTVNGSGGQPMVEASRFLGAAPAPAQGDANESDELKVERDALQDEVTRLRQQSGQQAARIQQLERTLLILQSRLGIAAAPANVKP
jgi:JAB1/Mov34/MPN/PAD-1 ubiquitin protease